MWLFNAGCDPCCIQNIISVNDREAAFDSVYNPFKYGAVTQTSVGPDTPQFVLRVNNNALSSDFTPPYTRLLAWLRLGGKRLLVGVGNATWLESTGSVTYSPATSVNGFLATAGLGMRVAASGRGLKNSASLGVQHGTQTVVAGSYLNAGLVALPTFFENKAIFGPTYQLFGSSVVSGGTTLGTSGDTPSVGAFPDVSLAVERMPDVNSEVILCGADIYALDAGAVPFWLRLVETPVP